MEKINCIPIEKHEQVIPIIRDLAERMVIRGNMVCLRHFRRDRLDLVIKTGTDRDGGSMIYNDSMDYSGPEIGRIPTKVTYARTVDVGNEPVISIPWKRKPFLLVDGMDYLKKMSNEYHQILYRPECLRRVSENEYWFNTLPIDAVIAVLISRA